MAEQLSALRRVAPADAPALASFFAALPEGDRTFFKEEIDVDTLARWCADGHSRWVLEGEDGTLQGSLALVPGVGWSSHVGDLRLVVAGAHRRKGLGRRLARHGLLEGVRMGLTKITVDVVAAQQADIRMFTAIGFEAEALLKNQIRDRRGELRDLVVMSHQVDDVWSGMHAIGLDDGTER
jgi:ribosomal protein S18 acetylase RimI-like enzyme